MQTLLAAPAPDEPDSAPMPGRMSRFSRLSRLGNTILTTDSRQRRTLSLLLLAGLVTLTVVLMLLYAATIGITEARQVIWLGALFGAFMCGFYAIIRSGFNRRFADPTLALPQVITAQTLIAVGYAMSGPLHGATAVLFCLVMVFGMFSLRARGLRIASLYTVTVMGAVMSWCANNLPEHYPARLELFNFVLTAVVLLAISQISGQLMAMRTRVKTQKLALEEALKHIEEMAARDDLTGLPNRRRMMTLVEEHASRYARGGPCFLVCLIDLDHFKSINDTYGHATGDAVLRAFAHQARAVLRATDMIGRWGGEEFLLLLPEGVSIAASGSGSGSAPGTAPDTAPDTASSSAPGSGSGGASGDPTLGIVRLRETLAAMPASPAFPELRIRFSAGLARYENGEPIEAAIERADRALYAAKSTGRDRSVML